MAATATTTRLRRQCHNLARAYPATNFTSDHVSRLGVRASLSRFSCDHQREQEEEECRGTSNVTLLLLLLLLLLPLLGSRARVITRRERTSFLPNDLTSATTANLTSASARLTRRIGRIIARASAPRNVARSQLSRDVVARVAILAGRKNRRRPSQIDKLRVAIGRN